MRELMGLLEQIDIRPRRALLEGQTGSRPRAVRGSTDSFLHHQPYISGDKISHVDWKKYAKTREIITKHFADSRNYEVALLLDTSASMAEGEPSKISYQRDLAWALSYCTLYHRHPLRLIDMGQKSMASFEPNVEHSMGLVEDWLEKREYTAKVLPMDWSFYGQMNRMVMFCLTDGWFSDYDVFLSHLYGKNNDATFVQILCEDEINPKMEGRYEFIDSETGQSLLLKVDQARMEKYKERLGQALSHREEKCGQLGMTYIKMLTTDPLKSFLTRLGR